MKPVTKLARVTMADRVAHVAHPVIQTGLTKEPTCIMCSISGGSQSTVREPPRRCGILPGRAHVLCTTPRSIQIRVSRSNYCVSPQSGCNITPTMASKWEVDSNNLATQWSRVGRRSTTSLRFIRGGNKEFSPTSYRTEQFTVATRSTTRTHCKMGRLFLAH